MQFPKRIVTLRKARKLTQQQMADKIGMHVSQYKRYEAGNSQPTLAVFRKIVLSLNISADALLFGEDERGPQDDILKLQFEAVSKLEEREKAIIMELIDGMLLKHEAKRWMQTR